MRKKPVSVAQRRVEPNVKSRRQGNCEWLGNRHCWPNLVFTDAFQRQVERKVGFAANIRCH